METENVKHETINKYYADEDCHRKNTATMFIADENGNIDSRNFITDMVQMFRSMPQRGTQIGGMRITYGEGTIEAQLPDNWFTRLLGDVGTIRITAEDIDRLASELIA